MENIKIDTFSRTPRSKRDADTNKGGVDTELGSGDDDYDYYEDDDEYVFVHLMFNSLRINLLERLEMEILAFSARIFRS